MKILILLLTIVSFAFAQQVDYDWGYIQGGSAMDGSGKTYLDTTTDATYDIYYDMQYWYPFDINPLFSDDSVLNVNSDRLYIGTFYGAFDNQGTASPTTDSIAYMINVYPGVFTSSSRAFAGVDWGASINLENVKQVNDYFSINNVYVHATKYKHFPPEALKFEIASKGTVGNDDSTYFNWKFAYPAIYQEHKERK